MSVATHTENDSKENKHREVETINRNLALSKQLPMGEEADNIIKWSNLMSDTKFYQTMVTAGGKNAILAIFLTARSLDIDPMLAINGGISCVQGRTMLSSALMNMLIRRQGHSIKKKIGTDRICHLIGRRRDNGDEMESVFTIEMAERANLTKNPVYKSYPERMLFNRALSNLAKDLFPDCIGNSLCEGEIDDTIDIPAPVEEAQLSKESMLFIDKYNLLDLESDASVFINSISVNLGQPRQKTISQAAKEPDKFEKNLARFIEKVGANKTAAAK